MKILALNCGSASVKYRLFEMDDEDRELGGGLMENVASYREAILAAIASLDEAPESIAAVGHRVVHGGDLFRGSALLDDRAARRIETLNDLAPLHNPLNLAGYYAARDVLPHCPHVAVFDTAFHHTLPPEAYLYALPYEMFARHKVRRYGFHGTSYQYLARRFAQLSRRPPEECKLIACHLGNGCSVAAIDGGRSVDTSMGFTPLEGLVMGTRAGDVDAGALLYIMEKEGLNIAETGALLNKCSGLYGVSGLSNDMRDLAAASRRGDERASLAMAVFCRRVKKYIGAYFALMGGADAIAFTAGIGENAAEIRAQICAGLGGLGVALDAEKNAAARGVEVDISAPGARTAVWVIPTREELMIARETRACVMRSGPPRTRPEAR